MTIFLRYRGFFLVVAVLIAAAVLAYLVDGYPRHLVLHEHGLIEGASAIGYFVCALLLARWGGNAYLQKNVALFVTVILLGCRELDFHKIFFSDGIFRTRFYINPDISPFEKILAIAIVVVILLAIFSTLRQHGAVLLNGLRSGKRGAVAAAFAISLGMVAKTVDGIERKLSLVGFQVSENLEQHMAVLEEVSELGIPMMMCLAVYYTLGPKKSLAAGPATTHKTAARSAVSCETT